MLTCQDAVHHVQCGMGAAAFADELKAVYAYFGEWAGRHSEKIKSCSAMPHDGLLVFFVVPTSDYYDFSLEEPLTALSIELSEKFQLLPCEVRQVPSHFPEVAPSTSEHD